MNKQRKAIIGSNEVSEIKSFVLAGYEQKVLFDGKSKKNPIMLCLHGGPGMPVPFSVGCRGMFPEFTDEFIMVYWDQLGCGINNYNLDDSFTIDLFVDMTVDLIKAIKQEYPNNRLIILGTSWGTILALKALAKVSNLVDSVFACGQILKELFCNQEVFTTLDNLNLPSKLRVTINDLKKKTTYTLNDLKSITAIIRKYTEGYQAKTDRKLPMGKIIRGLLSGPDYGFKDFLAIVQNGYIKNSSLFIELLSIDLTKELGAVTIPYRILQGSTDIVTSTKMISEFVSTSNNENLSYRIIDQCGHIPSAYGMDAILEELLKVKQA